MLHSHLYGHSKDLFKVIPFAEISSADGVSKTCKCLYKTYALTVVRNAYSDFQNLLLTKSGKNESFRNFESRFTPAGARIKSDSRNALPE